MINGTDHPYGYNGVEENDELGLNMLSMDLRQYDPAIARWTSIDPVTHHSNSTYNAFDNNPVFWADPSGADAQKIDFGQIRRNAMGEDVFSDSGKNYNYIGEGDPNSQSGNNCSDCETLLDWYNWLTGDPARKARLKESAKQQGIGVLKGVIESVDTQGLIEITEVTKEQKAGYVVGIVLFALFEPGPGGELKAANKIIGLGTKADLYKHAGKAITYHGNNWYKLGLTNIDNYNLGGSQRW